MTDKEKLIELLQRCVETLPTDKFSEHLVDEILADGWIRLPCNVGDTVYFTNDDPHCSAEIDGIHIDEQGIHFGWVQYDVGVDITELWDEGEFDIDEIGKTVFLIFEEFEKALAERSSTDV